MPDLAHLLPGSLIGGIGSSAGAGSGMAPPEPRPSNNTNQSMGPVNNRQSANAGNTTNSISFPTPGLSMAMVILGIIALVAFLLWRLW